MKIVEVDYLSQHPQPQFDDSPNVYSTHEFDQICSLNFRQGDVKADNDLMVAAFGSSSWALILWAFNRMPSSNYRIAVAC